MIIDDPKVRRLPASHIVAIVVPIVIVVIIVGLIVSYCRKMRQTEHTLASFKEQEQNFQERTTVEESRMPTDVKQVFFVCQFLTFGLTSLPDHRRINQASSNKSSLSRRTNIRRRL